MCFLFVCVQEAHDSETMQCVVCLCVQAAHDSETERSEGTLQLAMAILGDHKANLFLSIMQLVMADCLCHEMQD